MKNSVDFSSYFHYLVLNREGKAGLGGWGEQGRGTNIESAQPFGASYSTE